MTRAAQLSVLVRAARQRIQQINRHRAERRGEWYASIRALMEQVPGGGWR
jgi:hypothetical protein